MGDLVSPPASAQASAAPVEPVALVPTGEWVVLAEPVPGIEAATIDVAVGHDAYIDLWLRAFPGRAAPLPPFDDPVVVFYGILVAFGCERATMDALVVDAGGRLVYGEFTRTPDRPNCGDVGGVHTFVVAIDRGALPGGRLTFRLEREFEVCADCGREREQVEVEL
jgi:hypothetical protein